VEKSESKIKKSQTKNGLKLTVILKTNAYTGTKSKKNWMIQNFTT